MASRNITEAIRLDALAYRIWCHAQPLAWECTVPELAEALDVSRRRVALALKRKGWLNRVRVSSTIPMGHPPSLSFGAEDPVMPRFAAALASWKVHHVRHR